jgi:hypothetical protein
MIQDKHAGPGIFRDGLEVRPTCFMENGKMGEKPLTNNDKEGKMKKSLAFLFAVFLMSLLLGDPGAARATSFEIGPNGTLNLSGVGSLDYSFEALESSFDLNEGETSSAYSFSLGVGTGTANIDLMLPATLDLKDQVGFIGITERFFQAGLISWGAPVTFSYGDDGSLKLDLDNLVGILLGTPLTINGRITNNPDAFPVPEPATMLLFGF